MASTTGAPAPDHFSHPRQRVALASRQACMQPRTPTPEAPHKPRCTACRPAHLPRQLLVIQRPCCLPSDGADNAQVQQVQGGLCIQLLLAIGGGACLGSTRAEEWAVSSAWRRQRQAVGAPSKLHAWGLARHAKSEAHRLLSQCGVLPSQNRIAQHPPCRLAAERSLKYSASFTISCRTNHS